jgi:hypothetical protein
MWREQTDVHHHTFSWWMDQHLVTWVFILSITKTHLKKPTIYKNVRDFCYAYFQVLCCTLNWSRLHNFIHDIFLWAETVWRSHTVEFSTKNCLRMGWRIAASCKKVRTLRQSTPFHEPRSCCVWIARFIHHTATASVTNVTETNSHVKKEQRRHWYIYMYMTWHIICTVCPRRNVPNFGSVFLMLKYTDITQNTYIQSWTVTEIMAREKCGLLAVPHTVPAQLTHSPYTAHARPWEFHCCQHCDCVMCCILYIFFQQI